MKSAFWTNTIWYIALGAISVAIAAAAIARSGERKKTFAFFFAVLGMTYLIEVFLLIVTDAYAYYPKIATDSFHESLIGNFFSQYSVSASAVLIATLGLSVRWQAGFSVAYFLIDVLFVRLGIYAHHWYNSWYTLAGFFAYSTLVKWWHGQVFHRQTKIIYFATLFLSVFSLPGNALGTPMNFLEIRRLGLGLYEQATKDHTATGVLLSILYAAVTIPLHRLKKRPVLKALAFMGIFAFEFVLYRAGVIWLRAGWLIAAPLIDVFGRYFFAGVLDRSLGRLYERPR